MWNDMDKVWQVCFELGWKSYCNGSIPVGSVVVDDKGKIVSKGRSMVNEKVILKDCISWNKLSHAELNALLQVSHHEHNKIKSYTLYTTMEPCPLCFGAVVMSNVRTIKFAARDRYAGSTNLKDKNDYIGSKPIKIFGHFEELEKIQIAIQTEYELNNSASCVQRLLEAWAIDCPEGVELGRKLYKTGMLRKAKEKGMSIFEVIEEINKI